MPNYLSPAVYIEEVSSGVKPIAGVSTSVGAFVGIAAKGAIGKAVLVTSWSQFVREFGSFFQPAEFVNSSDHSKTHPAYLAYAVYGFFAEGGSSCYVVRTCHYTNTGGITALVSHNLLLDDQSKSCAYVAASSEGEWGDKLHVKVGAATVSGFKLTVYTIDETTQEETVLEIIDNLTIATVEEAVATNSALIRVDLSWNESGATVDGSGNPPKMGSSILLGGGKNGLDSISSTDYIGQEDLQNGIHAFDIIDGINIMAIPDAAYNATDNVAVIKAALNYCSARKDCFFIADPPPKKSVDEVKTFRTFFSSYGALYYPWVSINDPLTKSQITVPPSGVVAGTYAYTDSNRGVHKAPAGTIEGYLDTALGVETVVTKAEHDKLNPVGINVIRSLPTGICIWGARTLSSDSEWTYVNVRRLLIYIEKSIYKGTQWVVFEPNSPALWGSVKRNLTAFLTRVWRDGALFGSTPEEAFFVKVDAENNPPDTRDLGQLIIDVGVAPVKPAEFVVIRISQKALS